MKKKYVDELDVSSLFVDKEEKKKARDLLGKYLDTYTIETIAHKNLLKQLIYLETLQTRIQTLLNDYNTREKTAPMQLIDTLHKNLNEITALKEQLAILGKESEAGDKDALKVLSTLKKKFKKWSEENQASRTLSCAHCGKMMLLRIRTDIWESQKHPYFQDRMLGNKYLVNLYRNNKLSKEDVANILETSPDYVDWLVEKWWKNESVVATTESSS